MVGVTNEKESDALMRIVSRIGIVRTYMIRRVVFFHPPDLDIILLDVLQVARAGVGDNHAVGEGKILTRGRCEQRGPWAVQRLYRFEAAPQ